MSNRVVYDKSTAFAILIIKLYKYLNDEKKEFVLSKQLLRSGTSIGANVREANFAQSKKDFLSKMNIALKEVAETEYWLELLYKTQYINEKENESINNDCIEIKKILHAIVKTTKSTLNYRRVGEMVSDFYRDMNIPLSCKVDKTIFKKLFYESADLSRADKDLFTEQIDKIIWAYCFKPDTINISPYKDEVREYTEIEIFEVRLLTAGKTRRIAEIIMRSIPYPIVLVFCLENIIQLGVAHQRNSLADPGRNTIEEMILTDSIDLDNLTDKDQTLLESLPLTKLSHMNYYRLYSDIVDRIITYNASQLTDGYIKGNSAAEIKDIYDKIAGIDRDIEKLRAELKKEDQLNSRVALNIEIKGLEAKKNDIFERLEIENI